MHILFLSRWFPFPENNGSKVRIFNVLKQLAKHHTIDLVSFHDEGLAPAHLEVMKQWCRRVEAVPFLDYKPGDMKALMAVFSSAPRSFVATDNPAMYAAAQRMAQDFPPDLVIAGELGMAPYAAKIDAPARAIDNLELGGIHNRYAGAQSMPARFRNGLTWTKMAAYFRTLLRKFNGCTVCSLDEMAIAQKLGHAGMSLVFVPNGIDMQSLQGEWGPPEGGSMIYTGALTFKINQEAVRHFADEILPLIVQAVPNAQMRVTGKITGVPEKSIPRHPSLHYTGYLEDVRPAIARSWASVVPLRAGSGTRIKIVESMAIGTPVVSTPKGAEGLDLQAGRDLLIADSPRDFADATVGLLSNASLRQSLVEQGRQTALARFDWGLLGNSLNSFVEEIAHAQPAAR